MFKVSAAVVLLLFSGIIHSSAQEKLHLADSMLSIGEIIVTANKFEEQSKYIAQKVEVIDSATIANSLSNNTAGLLEQSGKIFVQKSQLGGGSPVLRGFEASRILMVVDGVRLNNAIYRTGHLQNIITIDDDILEKVEVLFGPASTIYGSDALGGVLHFQTKKPVFSSSAGTLIKTNASTKYSGAGNEYSGHVDLNFGWKNFASLSSVSYSHFGNLRQGNNRNPFYGDFGKRKEYIDQINGQDSIVQNNDENIQKFSGYNQFDLLQKFLWQPGFNQTHELNLQYSTSSNVPRYDRLTDRRDNKLRWAEWYYGPQERLMASYRYKAKITHAFFDQVMSGVNYQKIQESRVQRQYRKAEQEHRVEDIQVVAANIDLRKGSGRNELNIGADAQFNFLKSTAYKQDIKNNEKTFGLDTRYPDGRNNMNYMGVYAQHLFKIIKDKLILNDGIRVNYVTLNSSFENTAVLLDLPFSQASQKNITYSANAGIIYLPDNKSKYSFNISTGFRAPNIDDIAKVFESAGGTQLVIPNPDLKPEQTINFDLGVNHNFNNWVYLEANAFYSFFQNAIVLDKFTLNGASEVIYDGKLTPVVASQNKARAYIYGFQGGLTLQPVRALKMYSHITYTYGRYFGLEETEVPMDHIPPVFGKTGISYQLGLFEGECYALYNGWKGVSEYSPSGEDNLQYATSEGMPSWYVLNISTLWTVNKHLKVQVALENVFDQNYRTFASDISGAGRNLILKLRASL
jgi:hemoglobin/transferrin/lactoferrin receptor protein